jgi:hypothetical protein
MQKRYQVSLTEENVQRFRAIAEKLRMPKLRAMSNVLDDSLRQIVESMEKFVEKGNPTLADLFKEIGRQMEGIEEEEKSLNVKPAPKTKVVAKKPREKVFRR